MAIQLLLQRTPERARLLWWEVAACAQQRLLLVAARRRTLGKSWPFRTHAAAAPETPSLRRFSRHKSGNHSRPSRHDPERSGGLGPSGN